MNFRLRWGSSRSDHEDRRTGGRKGGSNSSRSSAQTFPIRHSTSPRWHSLSLSSSSSKDEERKGLMLTSEKNSRRPVSPNRGSPFPVLLACSRYVVKSSEMASERELYYVHTTSTRSCTGKQWQVPQPLPLALVAPKPTLR